MVSVSCGENYSRLQKLESRYDTLIQDLYREAVNEDIDDDDGIELRASTTIIEEDEQDDQAPRVPVNHQFSNRGLLVNRP